MFKRFLSAGQNLLQRQQSTILSAAVIITATVFLSALLGLLKNRLLVSYFFENESTRAALDAFWVAFRLPELAFQLLVTSTLSAAFIPVFTKYKIKDETLANKVASSTITLITILYLIASAFIVIFSEPLINAFTGDGFTQDQLNLAISYTKIILIAQFFFAISNFATAVIHANKRFIIPALAPSAYNIGIILGIVLLGPSIGVLGAVIGVVIGSLLHLAIQIPITFKLNFIYTPSLNFHLKGLREIIRLTPARTLAILTMQVETFAFTFLATTQSQGNLTIFVLAQQLMNLPVRVFATPIGQASLPFLSQESASNKLKQFQSTLTNSLNQILFLAIPASVALIILRIPLVRIAFGASAFPWEATLLTGKIVAILAVGIFAHAATQLFNRAFYALHNTTTPFVASALSVVTSIASACYFVFVLDFGLIGIALGATLGALLQGFILLLGIAHRLKGFDWPALLVPQLKIVFASAVMGFLLWFLMRFFDEFIFDTTRTLNLILLTTAASLIGAIVYYRLSVILNIHELEAYKQIARKLGNWRKALSQTPEPPDQGSPSA